MIEHDRYGVRIVPGVAGVDTYNTVKITRFDIGRSRGKTEPDKERLIKLQDAYDLQAKEIVGKAFAPGILYTVKKKKTQKEMEYEALNRNLFGVCITLWYSYNRFLTDWVAL